MTEAPIVLDLRDEREGGVHALSIVVLDRETALHAMLEELGGHLRAGKGFVRSGHRSTWPEATPTKV
jgi:hypothetical protein